VKKLPDSPKVGETEGLTTVSCCLECALRRRVAFVPNLGTHGRHGE